MLLRLAIEIIGFLGWVRYEILPTVLPVTLILAVAYLCTVAIAQTALR